ncbi:MAG: glycosyltransferase WbuB [Gammaproteobacteria bacterium]|nr:MAG: glycosyltransferase WbuB [Gammaproteobacteria bacterium]
MRILFLTHYFPPEVNAPASRTFEHCRAWVEAGHEVTVLTCAPNHPAGRVYPGHRNRLWQTETNAGIRVCRVWTLLAPNRGTVRRTLNYLSYLLMAVLAAPFLRRADVVVSTSPQFFCGLAGYFVSRLHRAPWVLEIRDLWPESIVTVGALAPSRATRLLERLEAWAYRHADRIVSVTDSFVPRIAERAGDAAKIRVIKNGVDLDFYRPDQDASALRAELGIGARFVAAYVGTHGMAHGLEVILRAADRLRDRPELLFLMAGDGAERARLLAEKERLRLDNVLMPGQLPKERMPALWALTDVSLVLLRDQPLFRTVLPSKLFEALGAAKPVILGVRGESAELLQASGAGICIEPENDAELAAAVSALAADRARCTALGRAGREYVQQHFDRRRLAARFEALLAEVVGGRREGSARSGLHK